MPTHDAPRRPGPLAAIALLVGIVALWWFHRQAEPRPEYFWRHYGFANVTVNLAATLLGLVTLLILRSEDRRRRTQQLGLSIGSLGLMLVVAEAFTLSGHDYRATFGTWWHRTWIERAIASNDPHPTLIHIHPPLLDVDTEVRGNLAGLGIPNPPLHRVRMRYDRNGFRNETDLERADVVVIGDSFVEGALIAHEDLLTTRLARQLGKTVANLGQAAYGPRQELIVLERFALPLKPSVVVWVVFGGNDFRDISIYDDAINRLESLHRESPFVTRSFSRNALLKLARLTTPRSGSDASTAKSRSAELGLESGARQRVYFAERRSPRRPEVDAVRKIGDQARAITEAAGARFLMVYAPTKLDAYSVAIQDPPTEPAPSADAAEALAKLRGGMLDLTPALRREARAGRPTYFPDDTHWDAHGHRIAAEQIAARIK